MALKSCVYRNCENFVNVIDKTCSKENITFFQFPKNPERRKKWMDLGKAPQNLPANYYYYCSDHFDKRFLSIGPRRTVLVGESVPYPWQGPDVVNTDQFITAEEELYLYNMKDDNDAVEQNDQHLQVESTTMHDNIIHFVSKELQLDDEDQAEILNAKEENKTKNVSNAYKRKQDIGSISPIPTSTTKLKILKCTSLSKPSYSNVVVAARPTNTELLPTDADPINRSPEAGITDVPINLESLIDSDHVTTFIFKGEEYVQMPKEHYVKEKIEMVKKLRKMENIITAIKEQLSSL